MNVLIVEDEVLIAMHLELLVTGFGHEVCAIALSAAEGIAHAAAARRGRRGRRQHRRRRWQAQRRFDFALGLVSVSQAPLQSRVACLAKLVC